MHTGQERSSGHWNVTCLKTMFRMWAPGPGPGPAARAKGPRQSDFALALDGWRTLTRIRGPWLGPRQRQTETEKDRDIQRQRLRQKETDRARRPQRRPQGPRRPQTRPQRRPQIRLQTRPQRRPQRSPKAAPDGPRDGPRHGPQTAPETDGPKRVPTGPIRALRLAGLSDPIHLGPFLLRPARLSDPI